MIASPFEKLKICMPEILSSPPIPAARRYHQGAADHSSSQAVSILWYRGPDYTEPEAMRGKPRPETCPNTPSIIAHMLLPHDRFGRFWEERSNNLECEGQIVVISRGGRPYLVQYGVNDVLIQSSILQHREYPPCTTSGKVQKC